MSKKPPLIVTASLLFLLFPYLSAWMAGAIEAATPIPPTAILGKHLEPAWVLAVFFLTSVCIFICKPWSFLIAIFCIASIGFHMGTTYVRNSEIVGPMPLLLLGMFLGTLALIFGNKSTRDIYWNKTLRWWEQEPRYRLETPAKLTFENGSIEGTLLNISVHGALLAVSKPIESAQSFPCEFHHQNLPYAWNCQVVHEMPSETPQYGLRFDHTASSKSSAKKICRGLFFGGQRIKGRSDDWVNRILSLI